MPRFFAAAAVAAITLVLTACDDGTPSTPSGSPARATGQSKALGAGTVQAWVVGGADAMPSAFGISFDESALNGLGSKPTETVLALPSAPNFPFKTAVIDWNPNGHPPAHVYDVPHFDFHFYTLDEATRMAIAPSGAAATAVPAPDLVPAKFVTDGETIPMMGKHYVPASVPEFNGGVFSATPIYGYWNGQLAFVESMVTRAYLSSHAALTAPLAQPARFEQSGLYPTEWSVSYDPAAHRYNVAFEKLAAR